MPILSPFRLDNIFVLILLCILEMIINDTADVEDCSRLQ